MPVSPGAEAKLPTIYPLLRKDTDRLPGATSRNTGAVLLCPSKRTVFQVPLGLGASSFFECHLTFSPLATLGKRTRTFSQGFLRTDSATLGDRRYQIIQSKWLKNLLSLSDLQQII
jgi:hypothetical protein